MRENEWGEKEREKGKKREGKRMEREGEGGRRWENGVFKFIEASIILVLMYLSINRVTEDKWNRLNEQFRKENRWKERKNNGSKTKYSEW